jgi:WD40 repeat protein
MVSSLFALLAVPAALGKSHDIAPRPVVMLLGSPAIIVQSAPDTATCYDLHGNVRHRFALGKRITQITVSADERLLLIAGDEGAVQLWRLADGQELLTLSVPNPDGEAVTGACFSGDGSAFGVCTNAGTVAVFRTTDGAPVGRVRAEFPLALALSADGSLGLVASLNGTVAAFDVRAGTVRPDVARGRKPMRATADGRYALLDVGEGAAGRLCVLELATGKTVKEFDETGETEGIRSLADGSVLVTRRASKDGNFGNEEVGLRFDPSKLALTELWRLPSPSIWKRAIDFDPQRGTGVTTDNALFTRVINLATGGSVLEIDNDPSRGNESSAGLGGAGRSDFENGLYAAAGVIGLLVLWGGWRFVRGRCSDRSPRPS